MSDRSQARVAGLVTHLVDRFVLGDVNREGNGQFVGILDGEPPRIMRNRLE
jgi:hypothetical protein